MKLRLIALASLLATSGAAMAGTKTFTFTPTGGVSTTITVVDAAAADTVKVYMSGASALRAVVLGEALSACGGAGTVNGGVRTLAYNATPGTSPSFQANQWAVACRLPAAFGSMPANTDVVFYKTDAGGSANGAFPISTGLGRPQLTTSLPTGCTGAIATATPNQITGCPTGPDVVAHFGISDVEPKMFAGPNVPNDPLDPDDNGYPQAGLDDGQLGDLTITPVVQTAMAVAVNTKLYGEMFAKQNLGTVINPRTGVACVVADFNDPVCVPSIGYGEARTFFSGGATDWRLLVRSTDPLTRSPVNLCRRVNGSGTQASANIHLMQIPCNTVGQVPAIADYSYSNPSVAPLSPSTGGQTSVLWTGAQIDAYLAGGIPNAIAQPVGTPSNTFVFEGPGSGDVVKCLNRAEAVGGYAIGHLSKENSPGTANWRHVKLEGAFPSRDALKAGQYDYAFESTVQYKTSAYDTFPANVKAYIDTMTLRLKTPASLASALATSNARFGIAALPDSYAGDFGTGTQAEIDFGSRVTRFSNSCTPFTAIK